jgi:chaperonin GroEL
MAKKKPAWQKPGVVFQPTLAQAWQQGIDQIVNAIAPTLGPFPRLVLYDTSIGSGRLPELLDSGGTIARRIIELKERDQDVGAMLIRHMLWQMHEEVGDGTATAAVLFQAIYREGVRYLASGGNAMRLRSYLEEGLRVILAELATMRRHLEGKESLARLAYTICYDEPLAKMMGEIFDIIGAYGRLELRSANGREIEREYVEGMYWDSALLSRTMINNQARQRADLENLAVVATDLDIEDPREMAALLNYCMTSGIERLLIVARKLSDPVLAMLAINREKGHLKLEVAGAKTPGISADDQQMALTDIAVLTGGRPLFRAAGDTLRQIRPEHVGRARRAWVDRSFVCIVGGKGDPRALRQHIAELRTLFARVADAGERTKLQERIGKLMGGSATLYLPGLTQPEQEFNKEVAQRTVNAMRGAMRDGVAPGGGVALLACRERLRAHFAEATEPEARAAGHILCNALDAPLRTLLLNAGLEPGAILADIQTAGPGYGFDVRAGRIVNMAEAGIFDAATVLEMAVHSAISTAAMALTTDVMVHRRATSTSMATG